MHDAILKGYFVIESIRR